MLRSTYKPQARSYVGISRGPICSARTKGIDFRHANINHKKSGQDTRKPSSRVQVFRLASEHEPAAQDTGKRVCEHRTIPAGVSVSVRSCQGWEEEGCEPRYAALRCKMILEGTGHGPLKLPGWFNFAIGTG